MTEINDSQGWHKHFSTVYDFFKKARWSHEQLSQSLLLWFLHYLNTSKRIVFAVDDTKAFKPHASKLPGLSWHADHHKFVKTKVKTDTGEELTATGVVGHQGHCWVVLAALHHAREMVCNSIQSLAVCAPEMGDNFYGAAAFANQVKADVLSLLKSTAVVYEPAPALTERHRGRPQKYGRKVKLIEELDQPERLRLHKVEVYGQTEFVELASFEGLLRGHQRPVKIVLVKGLRKFNFLLFTNDRDLSLVEMVEHYAARFQIEIAFGELKQELGTFNYRLRSLTAILRYVHLSFVAYALLKCLAIQGQIQPQETAWYHPKGLAWPLRVQQTIGEKLRTFRIFQGLAEAGYLRKNTLPTELSQFAAI